MKNGESINKRALLSGITLESSEASTQAVADRLMMDTSNCDVLNLVATYTTGSAETNNTAAITVWGYAGTKGLEAEIAADTSGWYQIGTSANSSGTVTFTASHFDIVGASAATAYNAHFIIPITWSRIRIAASESGVAANKGTLTVIASAK